MPDGLNLNPTSGVISGEPTQSGSFTVDLTATDVAGNQGTNALALEIAQAVVTVSGITASNKVYDAGLAAALNTEGAALVGVLSTSDDVTLDVSGASGAFTNKTVGLSKRVEISGLSLTGTNATNYSLTQPTTTADITAKELTVSGVTANDKIYDATTVAGLNTGLAQLVGVIAGDIVTLHATGAAGAFVTETVGTGKTVLVSGLTIGGADAGNYSLTQPTATASIGSRVLTVSGARAGSRLYDGSVNAMLDLRQAALVGVAGGDAVALNVAGAKGVFADKKAGAGKTVFVSGLTLVGADAGEYSLAQPTTTGDIVAKPLTANMISAANKAYDGTTAATLNLGQAVLEGVIGADSVALNTAYAVGSFQTPSVGAAKAVRISNLGLVGGDAGNYSLTEPTLTADITAKGLTVTGIAAASKPYDGNATAALNTSKAVLVGAPGDGSVKLGTAGAVGAFENKKVGTGKTVLVSGFDAGRLGRRQLHAGPTHSHGGHPGRLADGEGSDGGQQDLRRDDHRPTEPRWRLAGRSYRRGRGDAQLDGSGGNLRQQDAGHGQDGHRQRSGPGGGPTAATTPSRNRRPPPTSRPRS